MSELGELRASLARAQRELEAANDRLDALEGARGATVLTPRVVERQRRRLIVVGAFSSIGTAVLLGLGALVLSPKAPPAVTPPVAVTPPPPPPLVTAAPPSESVAIVPEPPPVVAEPPRPPQRVARVTTSDPARDRGAKDETGSLTVICLPSKCNAITDNGVVLGPGHIFNRPVAAGPHQLMLESESGVKKMVRVDVRPGQLREVRVAMLDPSDVF